MTNAATAVMDAVGKLMGSLGTLWVHVGTPNLTGGAGPGGRAAGDVAPHSGNLVTVLGWATWVCLGVAVLSLIALGARMGSPRHRDTGDHVDRLVVVFAGTLIISSAGAITTAVLPQVASRGSAAVAYLQNSLWWYMAAAVVLSVVVGGGRMAWTQRADAGKDLLRSLFTLIVVSGAGLAVMGLLVEASDAFAIWMINGSIGCDVAARGGTCFGGNMVALLALTSHTPGVSGLGPILLIVLGLGAVFASLVQIILMLARSAMLVILAGILPLSAAATNTEMGRTWFKRSVGWSVAFCLYKPAAAIVYAAAFKLAGTNVFTDDGSGLVSVLVGVMTLIFALLALPALMRFVTPLVGPLLGGGGGGAGGALALGALAVLPTGAVQGGRLAQGSTGGPLAPPPPAAAPQGSGPGGTGAAGAGGPGGSSGPSGPGGASGPGTVGGSGRDGTGAGPASGRATDAGGAAPPAATGGTASTGGAAGASAAGSGAAGAGAGTAAAGAAGPVGAGIAAGAAAVQGVTTAARAAAAGAADAASGMGEGAPVATAELNGGVSGMAEAQLRRGKDADGGR